MSYRSFQDGSILVDAVCIISNFDGSIPTPKFDNVVM